MKKITALILALITCFTLATYVSADSYTIGADGNAVYESALGYVFTIDDVNGVIEGEDGTVVTDYNAFVASRSTWAVWFYAEKVSDGVYLVKTNGEAMNGTMPTVDMKADSIAVIVHSASSNPNDASTYPNWEDKVAALAVKIGDYIVLNGIDLASGSCENGTVTVVTEEDAQKGGTTVPPAESSDPVTDESKQEESKPAVSAPAEPVEDSDDEVKSSTMSIKDGWFEKNGTIILWVLAGIALVAILAAIIVVIVKNKPSKEAEEAPVEAPAEATVEAPAEAPVEAPAEAPVEAPAEAPVEENKE